MKARAAVDQSNDWLASDMTRRANLETSQTLMPESSLPDIRAEPSWVKRRTVTLR